MRAEVSIRRASLSDREAVLDIDRLLYDGRDYMPTMYSEIVQNPIYRCYVAETADGCIVSFMAMMVDPEEQFCGMLSARTRKDYQGQGINESMKKNAFKDMYNDFGQMFEQLYVSSDKPLYTRKFWSDPKRKLIQRHALLVYIVPRGKIAATAKASRTSPRVIDVTVEELPADRAYQVLSDPYTLQHTLRKSHLSAFNNVIPMPKTPKYLEQIAADCKVFASFKTGLPTKASGISYSSFKKGPGYANVDIFLSVYEHVDILLSHLSKHLTYAASDIPSDHTVILRLDFPPEVDKEIVKEFLYPTLGVNFLGKSNPREYVLLWSEAPTPIKSRL